MVRRTRSQVLVGEQELLRWFVVVPDVQLHGVPRARSVFDDCADLWPGHRFDSSSPFGIRGTPSAGFTCVHPKLMTPRRLQPLRMSS